MAGVRPRQIWGINSASKMYSPHLVSKIFKANKVLLLNKAVLGDGAWDLFAIAHPFSIHRYIHYDIAYSVIGVNFWCFQ